MKTIRTILGKRQVADTVSEAYQEARRVKNRSWYLLLESLDLYEQAELLFKERTDVIRERHGLQPGQPLTVEAVRDRMLDEQWQASIADAPHYARRITAYATAYRAAEHREAEVLEESERVMRERATVRQRAA